MKTKPCHFFRQGRCKDSAEECKFLHLKREEIRCRYQKKGKCSKGEQCPFKHVDMDAEKKKQAEVKSKESTDKRSETDCRFFLKGQCKNEENGLCKFRHNPEKARERRMSLSVHPSQKNVDVGMQTQLHSLTQNMTKMMVEIEKMNKKINPPRERK